MTSLHRRLAVAVAIALVAPSITPRAARADDEADAKDMFTKGRDLRTKGDCKDALPYFRKAAKLYPQGLGSLRNLAECEEQIGLWASAHRDWIDLKRQLLTNQDPKYQGWDGEAEAGAARVASKVSKLTIVLVDKGSGGPVDNKVFTVTINGETLDNRLIGTDLDRDPGEYQVSVEGGKQPASASTTLGMADAKRLEIPVEMPDVPKADLSSDLVATREVKDSGATMRTVGYVSMGVGALAVGGLVASLVVRGSALNDLKNKCSYYESASSSNPCPSSADSAISRGKTASLLADVFTGAAVVALGVGFVLVVTNPAPTEKSGAPTPVATVSLNPMPLWGGGGAALTGSF